MTQHLRLFVISDWQPQFGPLSLQITCFPFHFCLHSHFARTSAGWNKISAPQAGVFYAAPVVYWTALRSLKSWSAEEKAARTKNGHPLRSVFPLGVELERGSDWHVVMWMKNSSFSCRSPGSAIDSPNASSDLINQTHLLAKNATICSSMLAASNL